MLRRLLTLVAVPLIAYPIFLTGLGMVAENVMFVIDLTVPRK